MVTCKRTLSRSESKALARAQKQTREEEEKMTAAEWTDYRAAADRAAKWAAALERGGREEEARLMRLLADAAGGRADDMAVTAVAGAPGGRVTTEFARAGRPCSLCGRAGAPSPDGAAMTCLNPDCNRFRLAVAAARF
jgi:hypothetical protein